MTKTEIINLLKGETLNNSELLGLLLDLKPESQEQEKLIGKLIGVIWKSKNEVIINDSISKYLKSVPFDEVENKKVDAVYNHYVKWCETEKHKVKSKIEFSRRVCSNYNLKTKVTKINGKSIRIYESQY